MVLEHIREENKGTFKAFIDGILAGKMTYSQAGENKFIIDHTEVDKQFSGKGVGNRLVIEAVTFARESQQKIVPLCPFARSVFEKTPEIRDVLF
ncbi:MAG: N-acetyltransferase [Crocinitomicaceae bacterium]|jgi:predicted GNAT family acetyltransferase|nr:N-acetyltransferase [Crocinitomicaceae bacterium]